MTQDRHTMYHTSIIPDIVPLSLQNGQQPQRDHF